MIFKIATEQEALKNLMATEYIRHFDEDINEINEALRELRERARQSMWAQIKNNYGLEGFADDILNSAFV